MSAPRTARVLREERRAAVSLTLGRVIDSSDLSNAAVGELLGVSDDMIRKYRDPNRYECALSVADLAALSLEMRRAFVEEHVLPGEMLVRLPEASSQRSSLAQHVCAHRETTEALTAHLDAIADGKVTREEGTRVLLEVDQAIRELLTMRAVALRAIEQGVVSIVEPAREVDACPACGHWHADGPRACVSSIPSVAERARSERGGPR